MLDGAWRGRKGREDGRGSPKRPAGWVRGGAWWAGPFRSGGLGALGLYEALEFHTFPLQPLHRYCTALLILPFSNKLTEVPVRYCLSCSSCDFSVPACSSTPRIKGLNVKASARNLEFRNIRTTSFVAWLGA
jgi:hypothetical protein